MKEDPQIYYTLDDFLVEDDPEHSHQDDKASSLFTREAPETGSKDPFENPYVTTDQYSTDDSRFPKQRLHSNIQRWYTVATPEGTNTKFYVSLCYFTEINSLFF